ncbi:MAG TPA: hypothetical protein DEB35_01890 [Desulfuromonas sp.]|nr:hypothetical protein [Desulfuromonas sp.]
MARRPLLLLFALLLCLPACGRKGAVRPLLKPLPGPPPGFTVRQDGARLLLSWDLPKTNLDGSPLTDLQGFRLYRIEFEPGRDCPECRDPDQPRADIDIDFLRGVVRQGDRFYLWDEAVRGGSGYRYRLKGMTRQGREGDGAQVSRIINLAPSPPRAPVAVALDRLVRLSWSAPESTPVGGRPLGYNIYRWVDGEPLPYLPLNSDLVTTEGFEDFGLINGTNYHYVVRTVVQFGADVVESSASEAVAATPVPEP